MFAQRFFQRVVTIGALGMLGAGCSEKPKSPDQASDSIKSRHQNNPLENLNPPRSPSNPGLESNSLKRPSTLARPRTLERQSTLGTRNKSSADSRSPAEIYEQNRKKKAQQQPFLKR